MKGWMCGECGKPCKDVNNECLFPIQHCLHRIDHDNDVEGQGSPASSRGSALIACLRAMSLQILDDLEEARRDASCAHAARDQARSELEAVVESRAAQDVDLMRMRHEYETDEILVVGHGVDGRRMQHEYETDEILVMGHEPWFMQACLAA